jgi:hypothetical protein
MPFELENRKDGPKGRDNNFHWLFNQEYKDGENHVTESLFKWFFLSTHKVQDRFLSEICSLRGNHSKKWTRLNLQSKGKTGTPDATLHFEDGMKILFEVKIKENSVSRTQLKRHLNDAGMKRARKAGAPHLTLVLITPDDETPRKLTDLPAEYAAAIRWVPWIRIMNFLSRKISRGFQSSDRFLRDGLLILLKDDYLNKFLP